MHAGTCALCRHSASAHDSNTPMPLFVNHSACSTGAGQSRWVQRQARESSTGAYLPCAEHPALEHARARSVVYACL